MVGGIEQLPQSQEVAGAPATEKTCAAPPESQAGPKLLAVRNAAGECVHIDSTEVTRAQYAAFLDSQPNPTSDSSCSWNSEFEPKCDGDSLSQPDDPELPVTCIDECDAVAFCAWSGKTLCSKASWYAACAGANRTQYPYGNQRERNRCNGYDNSTPGLGCKEPGCPLIPEAKLETCSNPEGVVHLSGNAEEWTAECEGRSGPDDVCNVRGGSVGTAIDSLTCSAADPRKRSSRLPYTGFRCCAE